MRIGFDITGLGADRRYTGMGEYAYRLVQHLAACDPIHEYVLLGHPDDVLPLSGPNIRRADLPEARAGRFSSIVSHQIHLPRLVRSLRLDVLHLPWVHVRPSHPAVPWHTACPLVVTLHDVIPLAYYAHRDPHSMPLRLRLFYRLNLRLAGNAARIITVSEHARSDILRHTRITPARLRVVPNGVMFPPLRLPPDEAALRRAALGLPEEYLLFAGSYEPRKNLRGALAAFARVAAQHPDLALVMVVERESGHAAALHAYARTLNLGERLVFLHSLSQDDLRFVYAQARLFLFPSFYEGFGFPPLQAMSSGIPVIAANTSSLPEILGQAARFIDPYQVDELPAAILALLHNPDECERLTRAGYAQAAQFTWERAARDTLAVYAEAASAG